MPIPYAAVGTGLTMCHGPGALAPAQVGDGVGVKVRVGVEVKLGLGVGVAVNEPHQRRLIPGTSELTMNRIVSPGATLNRSA